jgi:nitrosocyanin
MPRTIVRPLLAAGLLLAAAGTRTRAEDVSVTMVNVEYEGTKLWLPGTVVVKRGTRVRIKLVNNVPSEPSHGFAIPAYGVAEVVTRGEPKQVEFTADRDGIFPIICQLHPSHVGGQLVVLADPGVAPSLTPKGPRR